MQSSDHELVFRYEVDPCYISDRSNSHPKLSHKWRIAYTYILHKNHQHKQRGTFNSLFRDVSGKQFSGNSPSLTS